MDILEEVTKEVSGYMDNLQVDNYRITGRSHFVNFEVKIDLESKEVDLYVSDTAIMAVSGGLDNYHDLEDSLETIARNNDYTLKTPRLPKRKNPNQLSFRFHHNME